MEAIIFLLTCYIIMLTVFFSYVTTITLKFGILPSISDSWYKLTKYKFAFSLFCIFFGFSALIVGLFLAEYYNKVDLQYMIFLAVVGILFVGAAPDFKVGMDKKVHSTAAVMAVIFSQLFIGFVFTDCYYVNIIFVLFSITMFLFKRKFSEIFWIEIVAFLSICYVFGIKILELSEIFKSYEI